MVVRKYANRRLYDTDQSRYVNLEWLAQRLRDGHSIEVVDAETGEDLTAQVLAQILLEVRDALPRIPKETMTRVLHLDDESMDEFFGAHIGRALADYLDGKPANVEDDAPEDALPSPDDWADEATGASSHVRKRADATTEDEVAALRRELDDLKALIRTALQRSS